MTRVQLLPSITRRIDPEFVAAELGAEPMAAVRCRDCGRETAARSWHGGVILEARCYYCGLEATERPGGVAARVAPIVYMAVALIVAVVVLTVTGCAGSLEASRADGIRARKVGAMAAPAGTPERCQQLDDRRSLFGGIGKTAAVLGGAAGLTTIPAEDPKLEAGLAIGAVVSGAVAAGAVFVSEQAGESWARDCK